MAKKPDMRMAAVEAAEMNAHVQRIATERARAERKAIPKMPARSDTPIADRVLTPSSDGSNAKIVRVRFSGTPDRYSDGQGGYYESSDIRKYDGRTIGKETYDPKDINLGTIQLKDNS